MTEGIYVLSAALLAVACYAAWRRYGWPGVVAVGAGAWALVSTVAALVGRRGMDLPDAPTLDRAAREAAAQRDAAARVAAEAAEVEARNAAAGDDPEAVARRMVERAGEA